MRLSVLALTLAGSLSLLGCTESSESSSDLATSSVTSELSTCGSCDGATAIDYRRGFGTFPWPTYAKQLTVVHMDGGPTYFYAWGVGGGAVQFLYRVRHLDETTFLREMTDALIVQQIPGSSRGYGIAGSWGKGPVPIDPGPIGFPGRYVQRMLASVQTMHDTQDFLNLAAPPLLSPTTGISSGY